MKSIARVLVTATVLALTLTACASDQKPPETAAAAEDFEKYKTVVDGSFVEPYAVTPIRDDVAIIDSRPARLYTEGHIPTAINIPDTQFDKFVSLLPEDRSKLVIFYCNGLKCPLSHSSARKAETLGHTNIVVYAAGFPDWQKRGGLVSVGTAQVKALIDAKDPTVIVDSRPKARKYDLGHIPGAINIPDSQFEKITAMLPADKNVPLLFYCDGPKCPLSASSAAKAKALGHTNVKTFVGGYPAWAAAYGGGGGAQASQGSGAAPAKAMPAMLEAGKGDGTVTVTSFEKALKQGASMLVVDVRTPAEYSRGSFKTAVNIPINDLEKKLDTLPKDKPIVFFCSTGGRGGEAYDMVKLLDAGVTGYFLDAEISFKNDGSHVIKARN